MNKKIARGNLHRLHNVFDGDLKDSVDIAYNCITIVEEIEDLIEDKRDFEKVTVEELREILEG